MSAYLITQNFSAERLREVQEQTFAPILLFKIMENIHLKQISNIVRENQHLKL